MIPCVVFTENHIILFLQYESKDVPPGYTAWYGLHGNSKYYNYTLNENGVLKNYSDREEEYLTDVIVRQPDDLYHFSRLNYLYIYFVFHRKISL